MDRRRIELQLRAIIVTYRIELRRRDSQTMQEFRDHAHSLLRSLEEEVQPHPDLQIALTEVRLEIDENDRRMSHGITDTVEARGATASDVG
ncbi:MAG: hypothetical protein ABIZ57_08325 [Candidatus Limnocylindria bacterium]